MDFLYTCDELINLVNPIKIIGQTSAKIIRICSLQEAKEGDISFLSNSKYRKDVENSKASVILLPQNFSSSPKPNQCFFLCDNPNSALSVLCKNIEAKFFHKQKVAIHPTAIIGENTTIGKNASIGANVTIEENVIIGDNVTIMPGCYIGYFARIGDDNVLHPGAKIMSFCEIKNRINLFQGAVIGSDGYGYETVNGMHEKISHIGNVVIDDDVDIGANTTIDRARFGSTYIGKGTKIDNLVQIGHNVTIGQKCLIVAQTGIAGSTTIGNHVIIGGQVGIAGHINIPDGTMIAGKSAVASYHKKFGKLLRGNPAESFKDINKFYVFRKKIPQLFGRVAALEEKIKN